MKVFVCVQSEEDGNILPTGILKVFTYREQADRYCEEQNAFIQRCVGMEMAYQRMMNHWVAKNEKLRDNELLYDEKLVEFRASLIEILGISNINGLRVSVVESDLDL